MSSTAPNPIRLFAFAMLKHWWALMSCAAFTGLGVYIAAMNKGNGWVVGGSGILAALFFVVAAYQTWRDEHERHVKEVAQLEREVRDQKRLRTAPMIVFEKWEDIPSEHPEAIVLGIDSRIQHGFYLKNVGGDAYSVRVERFQIEPSVWAASKTVQFLASGETGFAFVWLEGYPPSNIHTEKWDLLGAMSKAAEARNTALYQPNYSVSVSVIYKDSPDENPQWYKTTSQMSFIPSQMRLDFDQPRRMTIAQPDTPNL